MSHNLQRETKQVNSTFEYDNRLCGYWDVVNRTRLQNAICGSIVGEVISGRNEKTTEGYCGKNNRHWPRHIKLTSVVFTMVQQQNDKQMQCFIIIIIRIWKELWKAEQSILADVTSIGLFFIYCIDQICRAPEEHAGWWNCLRRKDRLGYPSQLRLRIYRAAPDSEVSRESDIWRLFISYMQPNVRLLNKVIASMVIRPLDEPIGPIAWSQTTDFEIGSI